MDSKINIGTLHNRTYGKLSTKRIFFGHQSVGYNIIDGIKMLEDRIPGINIKIVEITTPGELQNISKGSIYHARIGTNFNPISKIDDFAHWINSGVGEKVDIAFMKLCFVDIGTETDVASLFDYYKKTMANIKKENPSLTIVHCTVPLVEEKTGFSKLKFWIKGIAKKIFRENEYYDNLSKFKYNELIRNEYCGKEPVFDLAAAESTFSDGHRSLVSLDGYSVETLIPAYTNDGGHLTTEGKMWIARNLLLFLANLP